MGKIMKQNSGCGRSIIYFYEADLFVHWLLCDNFELVYHYKLAYCYFILNFFNYSITLFT